MAGAGTPEGSTGEGEAPDGDGTDVTAGLDAPEGVSLTAVPSTETETETEAEIEAEAEEEAGTEADAVPPSGSHGPSAAPAATSRQTAHLDDHTAGSPGAMRSASHGLRHPASRTGEEEITGRSGVDCHPGTEIRSPTVIRNEHLARP
ncbi:MULTISPECIES: hypothetical protein [Streptomyces]|uniref:hypothetical protein n=1 Tax=Streptomyces TaxID=1883 RepID=UPI00131544E6|nr:MULTISPECIES: hypothetical protein [Streptomyces]